MNEYDFNHEDKKNSKYLAATPIRVMLKIIFVIGLIEGSIMYVLSFLPQLPFFVLGAIDAVLLAILSAIPIWFWIIRPVKMFAGKYFIHLESLERAIDESGIVAVADIDGKVTHVNEKFLSLTHLRKEELIGQDHRLINFGFESEERYSDFLKTISSGKIWKGEIQGRKKDGSSFWVDSTSVPLKNSDGTLSQYISIRFDITERKLLEARLLKAKEEAENASLAKARFLANMSHEIRTPMNGIIGMANLLLESTKNHSEIERLNVIQNCGNTLLALINDVLDFSKLEVDKVELENVSFQVHDAAREIVELLKQRALEKNLELTYTHDSKMPDWIYGDVTRFKQILTNLIGNAVKFTESGKIEISSSAKLLSDKKWKLQFSVKDTGIGISDEVKNKLFQSFSQVDASTTRRFGGSGLGLAISKGLCEKMGGSIWVETEISKGSTFFFEIVAEESAPENREQNLNQFSGIDPHMSTKHPLKILVVEDNKVNQLVVIGFLKRLGYPAKIANNGLEALEILKHEMFDLILMDCHMSEMDGFEATTKIIQIYQNSRPRIVALTASTMSDDVLKCYECGMEGVMGKPITVPSLVKTLQETKPLSQKKAA